MFIERFEPAIADTDGLRHLNNLGIMYWMEKARNPLFKIFNPSLEFAKWNLIMVHNEFDFLHQIFFCCECEIKTYVSKIGNSSVTIYQEIYQKEVLCAKCSIVMVYFDFEGQKSMLLPEEIKNELKKHLYKDNNGC